MSQADRCSTGTADREQPSASGSLLRTRGFRLDGDPVISASMRLDAGSGLPVCAVMARFW